MHACMYVRTYVCMYVRIYVYMFVSVCSLLIDEKYGLLCLVLTDLKNNNKQIIIQTYHGSSRGSFVLTGGGGVNQKTPRRRHLK